MQIRLQQICARASDHCAVAVAACFQYSFHKPQMARTGGPLVATRPTPHLTEGTCEKSRRLPDGEAEPHDTLPLLLRNHGAGLPNLHSRKPPVLINLPSEQSGGS